ncbi:HEAT repeat-containing protein 6 [Tanacetum coccineum]
MTVTLIYAPSAAYTGGFTTALNQLSQSKRYLHQLVAKGHPEPSAPREQPVKKSGVPSWHDSDGSTKGNGNFQISKVRVADIVCIQDLCPSDSMSFTAQWTILLLSSDVLQERRYEANLMTCLLFYPHLMARIASASTLTTMLEGLASVFLQVAEFKGSTKLGSFTSFLFAWSDFNASSHVYLKLLLAWYHVLCKRSPHYCINIAAVFL